MKPILEVKNLNKTFSANGKQDVVALSDINFHLKKGEILGIVGESGSGKSTIAKAVTRLIDATDGTILLKGQDITSVRGARQRKIYQDIQMVFQTPAGSFNPRKTIGDGVTASLRNQGISKKEAQERGEKLLAQCGISKEYMDRYPHQISGGQCQRAAIARALAVEPEILIFDEATSALDVTIQKQIMELLKDLHKENNMSYIFICHNLALVQSFCDRVLVMYDGKIVEENTPDEIIFNPKAEYTRRLVEAALL